MEELTYIIENHKLKKELNILKGFIKHLSKQKITEADIESIRSELENYILLLSRQTEIVTYERDFANAEIDRKTKKIYEMEFEIKHLRQKLRHTLNFVPNKALEGE